MYVVEVLMYIYFCMSGTQPYLPTYISDDNDGCMYECLGYI